MAGGKHGHTTEAIMAEIVHIVATDDRSDDQINRADAASHDDRVEQCILLTKTDAITIEHDASRNASF